MKSGQNYPLGKEMTLNFKKSLDHRFLMSECESEGDKNPLLISQVLSDDLVYESSACGHNRFRMTWIANN